MRNATTKDDQVSRFRRDVQEKIQLHIRDAIETVLEEELADALDSQAYERSEGRRGYRHGVERRMLTTEAGTREVRVPRGRLKREDGTTAEFRSEGCCRARRAGRESSTRRSWASTWPAAIPDASGRPWSRCWARLTCPRARCPEPLVD